MDLIPGNADGHHDVGNGMRLREHVLDLLARINVPVRHIMGPHIGFLFLRQAFALTDMFHDVEGIDRLQLLFQKVGHDIVTARDRFRQRMPRLHKCFRVARPDVRTMGKT